MMLLASLILGVATGAFVTFAFPRLWRKLNPSKGGRITLTALGAITGIFVLVLIRGILLSDYRTLGLTREDWHIMMFLGTLVAMPFFWYFATKKVIPWIEGTITL